MGLRPREVGEIQVRIDAVPGKDGIVRAARHITDDLLERKAPAASDELDLISAAYGRLVLAKPGNLPRKANLRTKVVQVARIDFLAGIL